MKLTVWGRNRDNDSLDAVSFLKENMGTELRLLDVERQPPTPVEWAHIIVHLGTLADAVDKHHPRFRDLFFDLHRLGEKDIAMRLHDHRDLIRCPILLTDDGALVGFRERAWREFLELPRMRRR